MSSKFLVMSSVALAASFGALADPLVSHDFEDGNRPAVWSAGTVTNETATSSSIGFATNVTHDLTLAISGEAKLTVSGAAPGADTEVDMLVKIVKPDENPTVEDIPATDGAPQIALGVSTNGELMVYCQGANGPVFATTSKICAGDTWARVNLVFDYTNGCCKVSVDGELATSSTLGYKTPSCTTTTTGGAWYKLVDNTNKKIASMQIIGSTSVDDVIVQNTPMETYSPRITDSTTGNVIADLNSSEVTVPAIYLKENGLVGTDGNTRNSANMTIGQAYKAGVSYTGNEKFAIASATQNGTTAPSFKLAFPGQWSASSYTVTCFSSPDRKDEVSGVTVSEQKKVDGQNFVTITIPTTDANALYFTVGR